MIKQVHISDYFLRERWHLNSFNSFLQLHDWVSCDGILASVLLCCKEFYRCGHWGMWSGEKMMHKAYFLKFNYWLLSNICRFRHIKYPIALCYLFSCVSHLIIPTTPQENNTFNFYMRKIECNNMNPQELAES